MRWAILIVALLVFLGFSATVVKNEPPNTKTEGNGVEVYFSADKFDAEGYVNSIWDQRVIPHIKEKAADVVELQNAVKADANAAGEKYGYRAVAEGNPYNFALKGRFKILSANVKSKNGRIEADAVPYDGQPDFVMQVGPIFKGTSIRDLLPFVTFDDFKNQVEFAKLASQLNIHIRDTVLTPLGFPGDGMAGKEFDFYGATTLEPGNPQFNVVPVILNPIAE